MFADHGHVLRIGDLVLPRAAGTTVRFISAFSMLNRMERRCHCGTPASAASFIWRTDRRYPS
ncbi:Uncharacterized protein MLTONO_p0321 (plasmid) [Mesorhizobium loti]|nr:Uncharacterized protein MLTONO_p0321 [Mesorhizobium loti]